jgi:hypothetical protein
MRFVSLGYKTAATPIRQVSEARKTVGTTSALLAHCKLPNC